MKRHKARQDMAPGPTSEDFDGNIKRIVEEQLLLALSSSSLGLHHWQIESLYFYSILAMGKQALKP